MFKTMFTPFLDADDGLSIGGAGAEEQELAEPAESEEGAEEQEVAEPAVSEEPETPSDSAWAALRRRAEEAESRQREIEAQNAMMAEALGLYFDGDPTEMALQARANAMGISPDVERERFEAEEARRNAEAEAESLRNELTRIEVERMMEQGLADIQKIDPSVTDLTELGEDFGRYIAAGLSSVDAYFATKAKEAKMKATPPKPIGRVASGKVDSSFFTKAEVDAMSDDEIEANLDAISQSMRKW